MQHLYSSSATREFAFKRHLLAPPPLPALILIPILTYLSPPPPTLLPPAALPLLYSTLGVPPAVAVYTLPALPAALYFLRGVRVIVSVSLDEPSDYGANF
ncbi:uncharacterized protein EDB91DRAFT_1256316 [Suillus paluster]|uniref:uncharacterized protein n=1 Tax=Suillus paluster TaxID=48578 RepID=UPI001B87DA68|nr:uncharacterized protein EDB91DRAFT_1256316 [Suillus paluster]KAG1721857.1 hypothetical protein EDB91DRAFT_1256316 [Suillus paluster]